MEDGGMRSGSVHFNYKNDVSHVPPRRKQILLTGVHLCSFGGRSMWSSYTQDIDVETCSHASGSSPYMSRKDLVIASSRWMMIFGGTSHTSNHSEGSLNRFCRGSIFRARLQRQVPPAATRASICLLDLWRFRRRIQS